MTNLAPTSPGIVGNIRAKITSTLTLFGAGAGVAIGFVLTYAGNVISGYPIKPPLETYLWHGGLFGILGAVFGPFMVWGILRDVPLWRAVLEPAAAAGAGAVLAMLLSAPSLFFPLVFAGGLGAIWRLRSAYRPADAHPTDPLPRVLR